MVDAPRLCLDGVVVCLVFWFGVPGPKTVHSQAGKEAWSRVQILVDVVGYSSCGSTTSVLVFCVLQRERANRTEQMRISMCPFHMTVDLKLLD